MRFNVGDIVRLKSGGPEMTVSEAEVSDIVMCMWFNDGLCHRDMFEPEMLELVDELN